MQQQADREAISGILDDENKRMGDKVARASVRQDSFILDQALDREAEEMILDQHSERKAAVKQDSFIVDRSAEEELEKILRGNNEQAENEQTNQEEAKIEDAKPEKSEVPDTILAQDFVLESDAEQSAEAIAEPLGLLASARSKGRAEDDSENFEPPEKIENSLVKGHNRSWMEPESPH